MQWDTLFLGWGRDRGLGEKSNQIRREENEKKCWMIRERERNWKISFEESSCFTSAFLRKLNHLCWPRLSAPSDDIHGHFTRTVIAEIFKVQQKTYLQFTKKLYSSAYFLKIAFYGGMQIPPGFEWQWRREESGDRCRSKWSWGTKRRASTWAVESLWGIAELNDIWRNLLCFHWHSAPVRGKKLFASFRWNSKVFR